MLDRSLSLRQLSYFHALANTLNFRQAAQELGISQPTLTEQVKALEEHLHVPLLERSRSGTKLSPQGRDLLQNVKLVLDSVTDLQKAAQLYRSDSAVTYRLGIPPTVGPYLLPHVLPTLHQQYNELKFYVREAAPKTLEQSLYSGEFDLILTPSPKEDAELSVEPLFTEPLKLVLPIDHPLAGQSAIEPQQLHGQNVLTLEEHHHFHHQVQTVCHKLGARLLRDYEGTSLDTLRQMVVMGMGIAFLPGLYINSELHKPEALQVCELRGTPITRQHALVWRKAAPGRVFFRTLAQQLRETINHRLGKVVDVHCR